MQTEPTCISLAGDWSDRPFDRARPICSPSSVLASDSASCLVGADRSLADRRSSAECLVDPDESDAMAVDRMSDSLSKSTTRAASPDSGSADDPHDDDEPHDDNDDSVNDDDPLDAEHLVGVGDDSDDSLDSSADLDERVAGLYASSTRGETTPKPGKPLIFSTNWRDGLCKSVRCPHQGEGGCLADITDAVALEMRKGMYCSEKERTMFLAANLIHDCHNNTYKLNGIRLCVPAVYGLFGIGWRKLKTMRDFLRTHGSMSNYLPHAAAAASAAAGKARRLSNKRVRRTAAEKVIEKSNLEEGRRGQAARTAAMEKTRMLMVLYILSSESESLGRSSRLLPQAYGATGLTPCVVAQIDKLVCSSNDTSSCTTSELAKTFDSIRDTQAHMSLDELCAAVSKVPEQIAALSQIDRRSLVVSQRRVRDVVARVKDEFKFEIAPSRGHQPICDTCSNAQKTLGQAETLIKRLEILAELRAHFEAVARARSTVAQIRDIARNLSTDGGVVLVRTDRPSTQDVYHWDAKSLERKAVPVATTQAFLTTIGQQEVLDLFVGIHPAEVIGSAFTGSSLLRWWSTRIEPILTSLRQAAKVGRYLDIVVVADNTSKEVRNAGFVGVLSSLVERTTTAADRVRVFVLFKLVGHGHDDLDAHFAMPELRMAATKRYSIGEFFRQYFENFGQKSSTPTSIEFGWRVPNLTEGLDGQVPGISKIHTILISRNADDGVSAWFGDYFWFNRTLHSSTDFASEHPILWKPLMEAAPIFPTPLEITNIIGQGMTVRESSKASQPLPAASLLTWISTVKSLETDAFQAKHLSVGPYRTLTKDERDEFSDIRNSAAHSVCNNLSAPPSVLYRAFQANKGDFDVKLVDWVSPSSPLSIPLSLPSSHASALSPVVKAASPAEAPAGAAALGSSITPASSSAASGPSSPQCCTCKVANESVVRCSHPACNEWACMRCGDWLSRGCRKNQRVWLCYECNFRGSLSPKDATCCVCHAESEITECVGCDRWWCGGCHNPPLEFPANITKLNWLCYRCEPYRELLAQIFTGVKARADYNPSDLLCRPRPASLSSSSSSLSKPQRRSPRTPASAPAADHEQISMQPGESNVRAKEK